MTDLVNRARGFAYEMHRQQLRRYTNEPYFVHLEEVAGIVERAGMSEAAIAAAWLHDVVEDCGVDSLFIFVNFGEAVGVMVAGLTDNPPTPGLNREHRKAKDRERLSNSGAETQGIKCADLISNTSSIVKHDPDFAKVYLKEKRAILEVLTRAPAALLERAWESLRSAENELLQNALATKDPAGEACSKG